MRKFNVSRFSTILALLICSHAIFNPLQAWIDHLFDFHFDRKEAGLQYDYEKHDGKSDVETHADKFCDRNSRDNSRADSEGRGTVLDGPDRDK